ncbi:Utp21 specific WD40 associated domain-containing protein [Cryptosporidium muris RN66]|uniref:Utp21 specific WD40 associated domain-containing protein n=1 Tax=Cryptosporidium muris (strain RN66) TaxID=441375 RepID=B6AI53_CRYMR|nr:Utp21 specific WD40 associated domain-containing protein [Cryptosporidium muris RN66]EEA07894.1 Utp21 specific WD40 associated domain-containing protein [Cryptosporidium muris RN66]|eukprot:XP_002142243.1 Utp21 specific WD40 associated domain-containing protein [Cryptosporidium muris RN66]
MENNTSSNILSPVHSIGYIIDKVPFIIEKLGTEYFVIVSIGYYYQVYDLDHLRIKYISVRMPEPIENMTVHYEVVYISMGRSIQGYHRFQKVIDLPNLHKTNIVGMFILGDYLISWDKSIVVVTDIKNKCTITEIQIDIDISSNIVTVLHPISYLNKILIVHSKGCELWNIRTNKRIHIFASLDSAILNSSSSVLRNSTIHNLSINFSTATCSNHPDIIGIGTKCGRILVLDLVNDIVLSQFQHSPEQGSVTTLSFQTDKPYLVSGCENGDVVLWDLEKTKVVHIIESVHESQVAHVSFVPGMPIFITSGHDNSLVQYILDGVNLTPRELRSRRGHSNPITWMSFYNALPEKGRDILCASNSHTCGYLGKISRIQQHQNRIFSQNALKKKFNESCFLPFKRLPPIVDVASAASRHYDWANIVSVHEKMHQVFVWSGHSSVLIPRYLTLEKYLKSRNKNEKSHLLNSSITSHAVTTSKRLLPIAKAVGVTECGNYAVVGYSDGTIHRFNLQSGLHSGEFVNKNETPRSILAIHISKSTLLLSVEHDEFNYYLSIWSIKPIKHLNTSTIGELKNNSHSEPFVSRLWGVFIGFGFSNGRVILYDYQSQIISREFKCTESSITDLTMSTDGRWLVISSTNSEMFIFDIISSSLLDWIKFKSPVIRCIFDDSNTFLVTSHSHSNGSLSIWANKLALTLNTSSDGLPKQPTKPILIEDPPNNFISDIEANERPSQDNESGIPDCMQTDPTTSLIHNTGNEKVDIAEKKLKSELIELSGLPIATIQSLLYLDVINERNKPVEPPKKPEDAPFFLPSMTDSKFDDYGNVDEIEHKKSQSKINYSKETNNNKPVLESGFKSELQILLSSIAYIESNKDESEDIISKITKLLKSKSPSGVHLLIKQLGPLSGGDIEEIVNMACYFEYAISLKTDADLLQAYLHIFLENHSDVILENIEHHDRLGRIIESLNKSTSADWAKLQNYLQDISCFLKFATNIQMD